MGEEKFERTKPHGTSGRSGHIDPWQGRLLTAAITKVLSKHNPKVAFPARSTRLTNAPGRSAERGITIAVCTWCMKHRTVHYAHMDCPGHAD